MSFLKRLMSYFIKPLEEKTVDWNFIRSLEGFELNGYVPQLKNGRVIGQSGVTIAGGLDLGQTDLGTLSSFDISENLRDKLDPYVGFKGHMAKSYLKDYPLKLTLKEAEELDIAVKKVYYEQVRKEFEDHSDLSFTYLNTAKQTVIFSVAYQYGSLKKRCPRFFKYVTKGMWLNAITELENFGDLYGSRRKKEAALLRSSLG